MKKHKFKCVFCGATKAILHMRGTSSAELNIEKPEGKDINWKTEQMEVDETWISCINGHIVSGYQNRLCDFLEDMKGE